MTRGSIIGLELIIGITAYSAFITMYYAGMYALQSQEARSFAAYSARVMEMEKIQGAVGQLDLKNLSYAQLTGLLNSSLGGSYALYRFSYGMGAPGCAAGCIGRIVTENGSSYYMEVQYNETSD